MIADLVAQSQAGNDSAMLKLVDKFKPLLRKYALKLKDDDAYYDLLADFLELVKSIPVKRMRNCSDGAYVTYVQKAIYNSYIKRSIQSQKDQMIIFYSDMSEGERYHMEERLSACDDYADIRKGMFCKVLTETERKVVEMIFFEGYPAPKIAAVCGISRQAVNQTKLRAIKKLAELEKCK